MIEVPRLETERLVLRGHRADDLDAMAAMWADPEVVRYIGGKPIARDEVWWKLLRYVGHWAVTGFGYWAITDRASGKYVGDAGYADFKRDGVDLMAGAPEIGWSLVSDCHGRGLATEAVGAAVAWGADHFGAIDTYCMIHPDNAASLRVAEKCSYVPVAESLYKGDPTVVCRRRP